VPGIVTIYAPWVDEQDLDALLACLATLNRYYLDAGRTRPLPLDGTVRYQREGVGEEEWVTLPLLNDLRIGDCEDLAAAYAASYGGKPIVYRAGPHTMHAVVDAGGRVIDPSRMLGMR
jgi:hypothetical protein